MQEKTVESLQHPKVKYLVRLRKEKIFRREEKKVLITGYKMVEELFQKKIEVEALFVEKNFDFQARVRGADGFEPR